MTASSGDAINISVHAGPLGDLNPVSKGAKQRLRRRVRCGSLQPTLVPTASLGVIWGPNLVPSLPSLHWKSRSSNAVKAMKGLFSQGLHTPWCSSVVSVISGLQPATLSILVPCAA